MAVVTVSAGTIAEEYQGSSPTPRLRVYVSGDFTTAENVNVLKSNFEEGDFFKSVNCTVDGSNIVHFPSFTLHSTTDAIANPDNAKYVFALFDSTGNFIQFVAKRIHVPPTPSPTTLAVLITLSLNPPVVDLPTDTFYTKTQTDSLLAAITLVLASQVEAEAGTNNTHFMSPLRVAEAIAALAGSGLTLASQAEAEAGTDNVKYMSALRTKQSITVAINALIAAAPGALDTLDELAAALGDDANFAATVTTALAAKAALAGATFTGDIIVPDEAYDSTNWNGSLEVPTKNALRDKIESLGGGGGGGDALVQPQSGTPSDTPDTTDGYPLRYDLDTGRMWLFDGTSWSWFTRTGTTDFDITLPIWGRYEASHDPTADGADVAGWTDLSGNGRDLVIGATAPVKRISSGVHSFDFSGGGYLTVPNMSALTAAEIFWVLKHDGTGLTRLHNVGASGDNYLPYSDGVYYEGWGRSDRQDSISVSGAMTRTNIHCWNVEAGVTSWNARGNGTVVKTTGSYTSSFPVTPLIGRAASGGTYAGRIYAIYIFEAALSTGQRSDFQTYLHDKFGITFA